MKARIGIIGCGQIVRTRHAHELATCQYGEIAGFYDYFEDRAKEFADKFGGKVYKDYAQMLDDENLDAVVVCTSNDTHTKISIEAINKGKHVLCEKPIFIDIEESNDLKEALRDDVIFMAAHNQRFTLAHKKAKELIDSNKMGKVLSFRCTLGHPGPERFSVNRSNSTWYLNKQASGLGCISDLGIHKVDVLMHIMGEKITEVASFAGTRDKKDETGELAKVYDNAVCVLKTESGIIGTLNLSYTNYGDWDNSTVYYCEKGVIKVHFLSDYAVEVVMDNGERILYKDIDSPRSGIMDSFAKAICNKEKSPVSLDEAINSMKVIFAIEEAYKNKKTVTIKY